MTWDDFKAITMPLAIQLGAEWDAPTWKLYHRAVEDIPVALYTSAIERASRERHKFPAVPVVREFAEERRRELLLAHPWEKCAACNYIGTVRVREGNRLLGEAPKYAPCECWHQHQARLEDLGVTSAPLSAGVTPLALPDGQQE